MAKLYFRYGAMNCGKTTALIQAAYNYEERGMLPVVLKPSADTKIAQKLSTRMGLSRKVDVLANEATDLEKRVLKLQQKVGKIHCVLSDESQFFNEKQIDQLFALAVTHGIPVLAYGIRTDFRSKLFPGSKRLMELAHQLEELKTICRCGKAARFNGRKLNGKFIFSGNQVAIDGKDDVEYESLCGKCYLSEKQKV